MRNLDKIRFAVVSVVFVAAITLAVCFPVSFNASSIAGDSTTLFDLPILGGVHVSKMLQVVVNIVIFFIFLIYFVFELLRGRITFLSTVKRSCAVALTVAGGFGAGLLISYLTARGTGLDYHFLAPLATVSSTTGKLVMLICSVVLALLVLSGYLLFRARIVRHSLSSMRSSASFTAAGKYALTVGYGAMLLQFIVAAVLLGLTGDNQLFLVPLACGTLAMALWRATSLKLFMPLAIFVIVIHSVAVMTAIATEMTIGLYAVLVANGILVFLLVLALADLYSLSRK